MQAGQTAVKASSKPPLPSPVLKLPATAAISIPGFCLHDSILMQSLHAPWLGAMADSWPDLDLSA